MSQRVAEQAATSPRWAQLSSTFLYSWDVMDAIAWYLYVP